MNHKHLRNSFDFVLNNRKNYVMICFLHQMETQEKSEPQMGFEPRECWRLPPFPYLRDWMTAPLPPLSQGLDPTLLHHAVTLRHISDATIQLPSESFEEEEENDTFFNINGN